MKAWGEGCVLGGGQIRVICCILGQFQYLDNYCWFLEPQKRDALQPPGFKVNDYNDVGGVGNLTPSVRWILRVAPDGAEICK